MECQGLITHWVKVLVALCSAWHRDFLLCVSHACVRDAGMLVAYMLIFWISDILPWKDSACHMHCIPYQMLCIASACVLWDNTYSCLFLTFCSVLLDAACQLLQFSYSFVCDQRFSCLSFHLMISSGPSVPQLLGPTVVPAHYVVSLMLLWAISSFMISCVTFESSILLIDCEPSVIFCLITFCCFYEESSHWFLCGFILFLCNLQYCSDDIVSLCCGLNFSLKILNSPVVLLHASFST